jgi:hypothetical protein
MGKLNLIGQKFGRLLVLEEVEPINGKSAWLCQCDCGNTKIVKTSLLKDKNCHSCGCLNNEKRLSRIDAMCIKRTKYTKLEATARVVWRNKYKEMDFEDFYEMSQLDCFYCGEPPSNITESSRTRSLKDEKESGIFIYNGLDRVDNNKVHTKENCVPCCKYCNYAKSDLTLKEFKEWVIAAYNGFIKSNKYCE